MSRWLLWVSGMGLALAVAGCTGTGDDTRIVALEASPERTTGDLRLPLVTPDRGAFRLVNAIFEIESRSGSGVFVRLDGDAEPDALELRATLPQGAYAVRLQDGWSLERLSGDAGAAAVNAALLSDNPRAFDIRDGQLTRIAYEFTTDDGVVRLGEGDVAIGVTVTPNEALSPCNVLDPATCPAGRTCLLSRRGGGAGFCAQPGSLPVGARCDGEQCVAGAQCLALAGDPGGASCRQLCDVAAPPADCNCRSLDFDGQVGVCVGAEPPPAEVPAQCSGGTEPGPEGAPWIVCEADGTSAWVSANARGLYHVDQICRGLGYARMSQYGGTCGNVCGYCQDPTSCEAPGERFFDGAGDCGTDDLGLQLCFTVMWECVR